MADPRELLAAVLAFSDATRRSGDAVLEALAATLRARDRRFDNILVFRPCGEDLVCAHAAGSRAEHLRRLRLGRDDRRYLPARAAEIGCRAMPDARADALLPTDRGAIAVPMFDRGALLAVAYVASSHCFESETCDAIVEIVQAAASPYAGALEREADRSDAEYDPLTGLLSPRAFHRRLTEETKRARSRGDVAFCLWYADTDGFKAINDRFGHRAGDGVLQAIAALIDTHVVRGLDVAARNGGDEFCALLRATGKGRALERAQALCDALRVHDVGVAARVTASLGVAAYPHDGTTPHALIEVADAAMYCSKRGGCDRVSFASSPGVYATFRPKAAGASSRSPERWRSKSGELPERRCSP